jgi:hypothetical protein
VRQLLASPPSAPAHELAPEHELNRLSRLVSRRSYLDTLASPHAH